MKYEIGDYIRYQARSAGIRGGEVIDKDDDIKNGRPGFSMRTPDGQRYWGYDDQIVSVGRRLDNFELL